MQLEIDAKAGALYLRLREGKVHETRPLLGYEVIVDLDEKGALLGVEVLNVPVRVDEFGYAHVDVATTTSEGRVIEFDPDQMRDEPREAAVDDPASPPLPRPTRKAKPARQAR